MLRWHRWLCLYLRVQCEVALGMTFKQLGIFFQRHYTSMPVTGKKIVLIVNEC